MQTRLRMRVAQNELEENKFQIAENNDDTQHFEGKKISEIFWRSH